MLHTASATKRTPSKGAQVARKDGTRCRMRARAVCAAAGVEPAKTRCVDRKRRRSQTTEAKTAVEGADFVDMTGSRVLVVGSTGYIGKFVVKELVDRGYQVVAFAREKSGIGGKLSMDDVQKEFEGAEVRFGDVCDVESLRERGCADGKVDVVVSCLASRTGGIEDSWRIDYQATKNALDVGKACGASKFVLLSAICVQKPLLEFQRAKLKFEEELMESGITYSIVRPTAFFKSLAGQVESVKKGGPYVMFGDGKLAACKPISERDLAKFMVDCITDEDKQNQVLPIGGPDEAMTALDQGEMLFRLLGKDPKFIRVPIGLMDGVIGIFDALAKIFPGLKDSAEFGRIGRYYAAESMLVLDPNTGEYDAFSTPSYGTDTLEAFFKGAIENGLEGQELGDQAIFGQK